MNIEDLREDIDDMMEEGVNLLQLNDPKFNILKYLRMIESAYINGNLDKVKEKQDELHKYYGVKVNLV